MSYGCQNKTMFLFTRIYLCGVGGLIFFRQQGPRFSLGSRDPSPSNPKISQMSQIRTSTGKKKTCQLQLLHGERMLCLKFFRKDTIILRPGHREPCDMGRLLLPHLILCKILEELLKNASPVSVVTKNMFVKFGISPTPPVTATDFQIGLQINCYTPVN